MTWNTWALLWGNLQGCERGPAYPTVTPFWPHGICKDPVSQQGHIHRFWVDRDAGVFSPQHSTHLPTMRPSAQPTPTVAHAEMLVAATGLRVAEAPKGRGPCVRTARDSCVVWQRRPRVAQVVAEARTSPQEGAELHMHWLHKL